MSSESTNDELVIGTGEQWLGHPRALFVLFFSEMWERFCYYGMRVLLILFLTKSLMHGDHGASLIYGAYCALVYAAPVLGGRMADRYLGYRYAIILGAILMSIGEFLILGGTDQFLLIGMGAIIIGNGYFKANISTIVGKLYKDGDSRRDSGFTIFYIGINVGALLATTVVAYIGETYGFKYGFGLAGLGMLMGMFIFWNGRKKYEGTPGLEIREEGKKKVLGPLNMVQVVTIGSLFLIPLCYILINQNEILKYIFLGLFILVAYQLISAGAKEGKVWKDRMIALVIFMVINIIFWACFEQAGTSLTLFADRNVDREIFGWLMPASMTQFFNPAFIIIFGSLFSVMWIKLSKIGKNPSIPMKFSLGIFQLGLGFLVTMVGFQLQTEFMVPLLTLVFLYLLHTTGELFISPIGLSMVTKLAPKHIAGTAMGGWFLSFAIANFLGGQIAALTGAEGGEEEGDKKKVALKMETTVKEGLKTDAKFEDWIVLENQPKNINVQKYYDLRDWVEFRASYDDSLSLNEWKGARTIDTKFKDANDWLNKDTWEDLNSKLVALNKKDENNSDAVGFDSWMYFRGGFFDDEEKVEKYLTEMDPNISLQAAFVEHQSVVNEKGLNKYVDIFSIIGFVLIGFSVLIALLRRPLNKLMHGVE
jgi:POT family proton-dependent oligopeptide transporter